MRQTRAAASPMRMASSTLLQILRLGPVKLRHRDRHRVLRKQVGTHLAAE